MPEPEAVRIPHAPPLRFARTLQHQPDGSRLVEAVVDADSPAADAARVRPGYLLEIAAQAAAAWRGSGSDDQDLRGGRLVGVADWRFLGAARVGIPIQVRVRLHTSLGPLSAFEVELAQAGTALASGRLQVHLAPA